MKSLFTLSFPILFGTVLFGQDVTIPDANFKSYLLANQAINTNSDTEIQVAEAQAFTGAIICEGWSIADLTGIEAFTSLSTLNCTNNLLTNITISANTQLTSLSCASNQLTSLDVSANVLLTSINCTDNLLTGLNISANTALTQLSIYTNSITSIDVSQNNALTHLWCMFNPISSIDLSQNENLIFLQANNCSLTTLNLANGNNTNFIGAKTNNNNLTCIEVDDALYSTTNWTSNDFSTDVGASYNENCAGTASLSDFQKNGVHVYPNPAQDVLNIELSEASSISIVDINGNQLLTSELNNLHQINVADLEDGIYFIQSDSGTTQKFIKH